MLSGFQVLDLCDESGSLAGKILAELGADVIKVEPPGGDASRNRGPHLGGEADPERSLRWLALNTSKRSLVLDLDSETGRATFGSLCARADVLLESGNGWLDERGVGLESLGVAHPHLVCCSISAFGRDGPYASFSASDLIVVAMGGNASMTGDPDRAPLRCSLSTSAMHAGAEAALGVLFGLWSRGRTGRGQIVDVSMQECQLQTLVAGPGQQALRAGEPRRSGPQTGRTREIWPARNGHVSYGLRGGPARARSLKATVDLMAEHDMAPQWLQAMDWSRYDPAALDASEIERIEEAFGAFFRSRTMAELYDEAMRRRILLAPCNDAREVLRQTQLRARGFFARVDYPELGVSIDHPSRFARSSRARIGLRSRAPRIGEHAREILAELEAPAAPRPSPSDVEVGEGHGIFRGLRILEFGSGAAGPLATRYFTEQGARVVRVESRKRPDFLRYFRPPKTERFGLDGSPMFVLLNPDKESVSLDLTHPAGVALARRLVAWADVVTENFAPGVMARWGLDYESLRHDRPDLVMVSSCLFGQTGPQRSYPGFGGQGAAIAGFNHLTGWPDREALGPYGTITDTLSPRYVALLVAAALLDRERTGLGQYLDVSQIETGVYSLSEMVVRQSAGSKMPTRLGNHDENAVPHAIYPCRGADRWIAVVVFGDGEWKTLVTAMGTPTWAQDVRFADAAGRRRHEEELDSRIGEWTRHQDGRSLMLRLQGAGVRAGVVQTFEDLLQDPQLAHRGHFRQLRHAHLGELAFERTGLRLAESPPRLEKPGPNLGEHTRRVLQEILTLAPEEVERHVAAGALR